MLLFLTIISILLLLGFVLSIIRNDYWLFKVFEYPRMQKLVLLVLVIAGWSFYFPLSGFFQRFLFFSLCAAALYTIYNIFPYTILAKKEVKHTPLSDGDCSIKIFAANVYQENRNYKKMLQQITEMDPDVIYLLETDIGWAEAVKELQQSYPHFLLEPRDNTYGLLFYSRYPFEKAKIVHLVKDEVPSIDAVVQLPCGQKIQVWGLHPEPPVPNENLYATAKNKELMKVAFKARESKLPCIVFGDLNDVAWSHTTRLFRRTSELLDPRIGRGFYNTFSAHHWFIRFPLDYIFCSPEFGLVKMERLPPNGSDHFATFTHLAFRPDLEPEQEKSEADEDDLEEAEEMIEKPLHENEKN